MSTGLSFNSLLFPQTLMGFSVPDMDIIFRLTEIIFSITDYFRYLLQTTFSQQACKGVYEL